MIIGSRVSFYETLKEIKVRREGIVSRVWTKPVADPYVTVKTDDDKGTGETFTRCTSQVEEI